MRAPFLEEIDPARSGTRLFRLPHKWAAEFVLRKDYCADWEVELLEEYTYFTADEFVEELARAGASSAPSPTGTRGSSRTVSKAGSACSTRGAAGSLGPRRISSP